MPAIRISRRDAIFDLGAVASNWDADRSGSIDILRLESEVEYLGVPL